MESLPWEHSAFQPAWYNGVFLFPEPCVQGGAWICNARRGLDYTGLYGTRLHGLDIGPGVIFGVNIVFRGASLLFLPDPGSADFPNRTSRIAIRQDDPSSLFTTHSLWMGTSSFPHSSDVKLDATVEMLYSTGEILPSDAIYPGKPFGTEEGRVPFESGTHFMGFGTLDTICYEAEVEGITYTMSPQQYACDAAWALTAPGWFGRRVIIGGDNYPQNGLPVYGRIGKSHMHYVLYEKNFRVVGTAIRSPADNLLTGPFSDQEEVELTLTSSTSENDIPIKIRRIYNPLP